MFGVLDLYTVGIIEKRLKHFSQCPDWLEFIFCGYADKSLVELVGPEYIKDAIDFVINNRIKVKPYYILDAKHEPSISVISSGTESQQFIGDHGYQQVASKQTVRSSPIVIAEWSAISIDKGIMKVPPQLGLDKKLWPGVLITNGTQTVVLEGIIDSGTLCLKSDLPDNLSPQGWRATTAGSNKIYTVNSSTDSVSVQCKLTTHGDPGNHRLLGVVLRAILKSARLDFDHIGFQNTKISYSPMMVTNQEELEFESVYSIDGIFTDHWIHREGQSVDAATNLVLGTTATNPNKGDVKIE